MSEEEYESFSNKIKIREVSIEYKRAEFRTKKRVLVTTFLEAQVVKKSDLEALYNCRWCVELALRSLKETMQMDILRGKTPEIVRKEIWTHVLAYNLIRETMMQAAILYHKTPQELSFKLALQLVRSFGSV